ncbi:MAG: hypothetical protein JXA21_05135 [Anaerolineae bacterium]|nr:hypothetical protein [Anaerolineae bacterium]
MTTQWMALVCIVGSIILFFIYRVKFRNKVPPLRSFPIFETLPDQVGRAAEEGNSIHIALGQGSLMGENAMVSTSALQSLRILMDLSAAYDTPPLITTGDPTLFLLANDRLRRAYVRIGNANLYRSGQVLFVAGSPLTYAAMSATYLLNGKMQSNIMLGAFDQEVSLLADAAYRRGIASSGGLVSPLSLSSLYPALSQDHLMMGEDMFAGAALAKPDPAYWASLWAQNALRWAIVAGVIASAFYSLLK